MITYEQAKKLKDAGFPQKKTCLCEDDICFHQHFPTLSELIEACGERVILFQTPKKNTWDEKEQRWVAGIVGDDDYLCFGESFIDTDLSHTEVGQSPEEAVANLWLALNKK